MEQFRYEALNAEGAVFTGAVRAATEREAARLLEKRGLSVVSLEAGAGAGTARRAGRLRTADVIMALQELATMLTSGVPIVDAVGSQAISAHHPRIVEAFTAMSRDLQRGQAFSATLAASGLPLPDYVVQLARAGELTGELGQALADAGAQLADEDNLRNEMRNALIYPAVLVPAGAGAVALMFLFVVPKFASLLARADDLPFLAWAVLGLGTWTNDNFVAIAALV